MPGDKCSEQNKVRDTGMEGSYLEGVLKKGLSEEVTIELNY